MLLRNSISTTKRFFQNTLRTFKSFFSCGTYQRLPKTPPQSPYPCGVATVDMNVQTSYKDLDNFYTDFTGRWGDSDRGKAKKGNNKEKIILSPTKQENDQVFTGSFMKFSKASSPLNNSQIERREDCYYKMKIAYEGKKQENSSCSKSWREGRSCLVAQKLKELEMMDVSNVDHVLDIEEVLHYYSRLTCPAYLDIVDKFFLDMYTEFFCQPASPRSVNSRPRLRSVRP